MSQSAVSAALGRLRQLIGDELFVRTGRGLRPTPRAAALAQPLAEVLERVREGILQGLHFEPRDATRSFRVAHSDVGAYVMWPRIVQAVRQEAPGIRLELRVLQQPEIAAGLADGTLDLAVGSYPKLPASLFQARLFDRDFVALMHERHRLAASRLTLRRFAAAPQLVVRLASGIQDRIDEALAEDGLRRTDVLELPSYLMMPPLLLSGDYLAVVPGQLAEAFQNSANGFTTRPLPINTPAATIRMYWSRSAQQDPANRWLRGLVQRVLTA